MPPIPAHPITAHTFVATEGTAPSAPIMSTAPAELRGLSACAQLFLYFLALSPPHLAPILSFPRKRYKFNFASVLKPAQPSPTPPVEQTPWTTSRETGILRLDYEGYSIWLDCKRRGAIRFHYNAQRDQGDLGRQATFALDPNVPAHCQQTSAAAYSHTPERYDRG
jgi:DNA/RNA endonuclease G (NUC1)